MRPCHILSSLWGRLPTLGSLVAIVLLLLFAFSYSTRDSSASRAVFTDNATTVGEITASLPVERRAVIFIGGIASKSECPDGIGLLKDDDGPTKDIAPNWLKKYLESNPGVQAKVNVSDFAYFSYSGEYCDGGTGENGSVPKYVPADTCFGIDEVYYPQLKDLIRKLTDKIPGMKVTLIGHSQGGFIATYTVGQLQKEDPGFVRERIASVVTFDSFPEGLPAGNHLDAFIELFARPGCGIGPVPVYDDWDSASEVAKTAKMAAQAVDGYVVKFYTLDATDGLYVPGFPVDLTDIIGETLHRIILGRDHHTIWIDETAKTNEFVGCAILRAEHSCNIDMIHINPLQLLRFLVPVVSGAPLLQLIVSWPGSTVDVTVIDPSGTTIDPSNLPPGVNHEIGPTFESYEFINPQPGEWVLELLGADVPETGEEVTILMDTEPSDTTPPVIIPTITGTLGDNSWYKSDVTVSWNVSDPESGIGDSSGCDSISLTMDTAGTTLTCSATNGADLWAPQSITVAIDKTTPVVTCDVSPNSLWPPNHKMVSVAASVAVDDALSGPAGFTLTSATSNEPDGGLGDGDSPNDIQEFDIETPDISGQLRAERSGDGIGRLYTLTYMGMDQAGNSEVCSTTVTVPHDQGRG